MFPCCILEVALLSPSLFRGSVFFMERPTGQTEATPTAFAAVMVGASRYVLCFMAPAFCFFTSQVLVPM